MPEEMVIFTRTFDFLVWLLERAEGFPKSQRFVVTQRLQHAALDFHERLFEADNDERNVRCANRNRNTPDNHNNNLGFRVVCGVPRFSRGRQCRAGQPSRSRR